jgi:hypothetical protein
MAARSFIDRDGTRWQAWDVIPTQHSGWSRAAQRHLPPSMAEGWLCFESEGSKRRVHPIPNGWDAWSDEALSRTCMEAEPVQPRLPRP